MAELTSWGIIALQSMSVRNPALWKVHPHQSSPFCGPSIHKPWRGLGGASKVFGAAWRLLSDHGQKNVLADWFSTKNLACIGPLADEVCQAWILAFVGWWSFQLWPCQSCLILLAWRCTKTMKTISWNIVVCTQAQDFHRISSPDPTISVCKKKAVDIKQRSAVTWPGLATLQMAESMMIWKNVVGLFSRRWWMDLLWRHWLHYVLQSKKQEIWRTSTKVQLLRGLLCNGPGFTSLYRFFPARTSRPGSNSVNSKSDNKTSIKTCWKACTGSYESCKKNLGWNL